jgi:predicted TPR repeat methyltransferase
VGALASVFASVRRVLEPGGCLAFTVELNKAGPELQLLSSLRYAHSEAYIRRLADESRFTVAHVSGAPLRYDHTAPVMGLYVYLERV